MRALIHEAMVLQVEPDGGDFPVAAPMFWTACAATVAAGYTYDKAGGTFAAPPPPPAPPSTADQAEAATRGRPEMLALGRAISANDALTEDELVALLRARLGG